MRPTTTLLAILLLLPTAASTWYGPGTAEPDTRQDRLDGYMWAAPPTPEIPLPVYFNAFQALPGTSLNPNSGTLGTSLLVGPSVHHRAMLGAWRDCNGDGYVGLAESAVQDYRSVLLDEAGRARCPPGNEHPTFNDGTWVNEFLTIGMVDPCEHKPESVRTKECPGVDAFAVNERVLYDTDTYVWGDLGAPGSLPEAECVVLPMPAGATSGTGAAIGYADCQSRRGIAHAVNAVDDDGQLGLRFEDPQRPEDSSSRLNQAFPVTLFGSPQGTGLLEDHRDDRAFTTWDCASPNAGPTLRDPTGQGSLPVTDPTGRLGAGTFPWVIVYTMTGIGFRDEDGDPSTPGVMRIQYAGADGRVVWTAPLAPSPGDPTSSWWSALVHAEDGVGADCDPENGGRLSPYSPAAALESDHPAALAGEKTRPSFTFLFFDGHRGFRPDVDAVLGPTTPSDGGILYTDHDRSGDGPLWSATAAVDQDPQVLDRASLGPAPRRVLTFYAHVGSGVITAEGLHLRALAPGTYGAENCGTAIGTGALRANGWECDPGAWWTDASGRDLRPRYADGTPYGRVVGDAFNARDVDCLDGAVIRPEGIHASLVQMTPTGTCEV